MEGSGYSMLVGGYKQSGEGGGKEPSVIQAMKQKLEKMEGVEGC